MASLIPLDSLRAAKHPCPPPLTAFLHRTEHCYWFYCGCALCQKMHAYTPEAILDHLEVYWDMPAAAAQAWCQQAVRTFVRARLSLASVPKEPPYAS